MFEKLMGEVKGIFNIVTLIEFGISICCILMGLVFFTNSTINYIVASIFTGIFLIANGICSIYSYIKRGDIVLYNNNLIYGIIFIVIGIVSLFLGKLLSIMVGIYLLVVGVQRINYGILLKKYNESSWILNLVIGILFLVIAIISFFTSRDAVVEVAGISLFGFGIIYFINNLLLRRRSKYFLA